ncbi:MAG TPA: response regulator [Micromonosporaceae bacterium]
MTRILVVDDDPQILRALRINLRARAYEVDLAADGSSALRAAGANRPDLVVLDLGLPDMDGATVIRGLRGWTNMPIIILSGRAGSLDKVEALDAGADDYVTKPFGIDELLARIRAVTRRVAPAGNSTPVIRIGQWMVDLGRRSVDGPQAQRAHLTPTEWQLLDILARNPDRLITQRHLLHEVWGPSYERQTHYLRQYMAQLRHKLEDDPAHPRHLITEPGMGYRFRPGVSGTVRDQTS